MRVGRIPYVNCYPVYGAIDRGVVPLGAEIVDGVPSALNAQMAAGALDVSVISAVEYARESDRYLLLPDLAISCDGPVRSVMLFSKRPASELGGRRVLVSRSSMTSLALLELLFEHVWDAKPAFVPADAELTDIARFGSEDHDARLVIGDAALRLGAHLHDANERDQLVARLGYRYAYDLGAEWKRWTDMPFVFAVWVAQRATDARAALDVHASLISSRNWGLKHLEPLAAQAALATGVSRGACLTYLSGLDYRLSYGHLAGLSEFFRRLVAAGRVPDGSLSFLAA
ncbi:MAG TPA: menaquinone biosynthesis protein [Gemmatimonadaceae bacterium]|jgi:chorismate dehydratase